MNFKTLHKQLATNKLNHKQLSALKGGNRQYFTTASIGKVVGWDDVVFRFSDQSASSTRTMPGSNNSNQNLDASSLNMEGIF